MNDAQEALKTVQVNIEGAMNAIQNLTDAKQSLPSYTTYQESLTLEKKSLEKIIENLRNEKQELDLVVEKTKKDFNDLKTELTETQNNFLSQTCAIKAASKPAARKAERNEDKAAISDTLDESTNQVSNSPSDSSLHSTSSPHQLIFGDEDMSFQCGEDEHDNDSLGDISITSAPSVLARVPTSNRKQHHAKRVLWSPKKWRRMVRNHRLQSIFIKNLD